MSRTIWRRQRGVRGQRGVGWTTRKGRRRAPRADRLDPRGSSLPLQVSLSTPLVCHTGRDSRHVVPEGGSRSFSLAWPLSVVCTLLERTHTNTDTGYERPCQEAWQQQQRASPHSILIIRTIQWETTTTTIPSLSFSLMAPSHFSWIKIMCTRMKDTPVEKYNGTKTESWCLNQSLNKALHEHHVA